MKSLPVSESRLEDLITIVDIGKQKFSNLLTKLANEPITIGSDGLLEIFRAELDDQVARVLLSHAASLCLLADEKNVEAIEVIKALISGLKHSNATEDFIMQFEEFSSNFEQLISSDVLYLSIKATNLFAADSNHLHDFKIYSDMRPVFDRHRKSIKASLLVNSLSITTSDSSENEQKIRVALRYSDLLQISEECKAAILKTKSLEASIKSSELGEIIVYGKTDDV